jgi:hypothetical protein
MLEDLPLTGDWRRRPGTLRAHFFGPRAAHDNDADFWARAPRCKIKSMRKDTDPAEGLRTRSPAVCQTCLIQWLLARQP